jgi:hypothetical protein
MVSNPEELLDNIYNAFNPLPLKPGNPAYVDCQEVRGDVNIIQDLGKIIRRSNELKYQLYSGYRGAGKTTELLRLKDYLEQNECFVVYFAADEEDLSIQDAQYADILLACTRNLLKDLKNIDPQPIINWLRARWKDLQDILATELSFEKLSIETQLSQFAKLTAAIRTEPSQRQKIRERVEPHTETLIEAINEFIADAKKQLPEGKKRLVIIADNLDRIVPIFRDNGRSNHEEIFLDRHEQLKALECHMVYTVPISMIYSKWATDLKDNYGIPNILPSIMVRWQDGNIYEDGLSKLRETIDLRIKLFSTKIDLATQVFESQEVLNKLCLMSGGYMRDLIQLVQVSINQTDTLPITKKAVQRAIDELRDVYRRAVEEDQWIVLATVYRKKEISNDNSHRALLFSRCLLEYRYIDENEKKQTWYDVHPLIVELPRFQEALSKYNDGK